MSKMIASAKIGETLNPQVVALAKLGLTDAEIEQVLADDKRIDKGEKLFELTAEQEKASKTARQVSRAPGVYQFQKRERKADTDKSQILQNLMGAVNADCEIVNPEREFLFTLDGRKYKVTLSCPRS